MSKENRRCVPLITSLLDASAAAPRSSCSAHRPSPQGQFDCKSGPASRFTDDAKRATQRLDDATGDRQAKSHTAVLLARDRALEAPEDALGVLGGDTDAPVRHGQARARGVRT